MTVCFSNDACWIITGFLLIVMFLSDGILFLTVPEHIITKQKRFCILVGWCYDLSLDIIEKIKGLKTLKYISYDDIQQNAQSERGIG